MSPQQDVPGILRKSYQLEVDGATFYALTADRPQQKPAIQALFSRLASDERQHQAFLREVAASYGARGAAAFDLEVERPDLSQFSDAIFTRTLREQADGAESEAGVLSVGVTLEKNAVAYFTSAAGEATDVQIQLFFQFLASWERQHLDALQNAYAAIRDDFWKKSGM